jgi:hypothetical protein
VRAEQRLFNDNAGKAADFKIVAHGQGREPTSRGIAARELLAGIERPVRCFARDVVDGDAPVVGPGHNARYRRLAGLGFQTAALCPVDIAERPYRLTRGEGIDACQSRGACRVGLVKLPVG